MDEGTGKTAGATPDGGAGGRRPLWVVVLLLVLAAGALWGSSRLAWLAEVVERPGGGVGVTVREGADHNPALVPLALLALAAIAAAVATGGWARRVLGALLVVVAGAALWLTVLQPGPGSGWSDHLGAQQVAKVRDADAQRPWAMALAGAGGGLVLAAGVLLVLRGHRMPRMGEKYRTPSASTRPVDPQRRMWDALDAGDDPTAGRERTD
ncbi:Trp biosynthesis-associated membrane protein [Streptoalloteichus hindustanus]|uniref:Trp region conserved hypothetical membrane protein n=1 Tax=Streptoalloteichus hindustanus TaxID=2017 RepID=A0A1M5APH7_STRHI|nr:Trp biosynthesis-associated membrane protein [Streptoalloteichus hindustanus]SHF32007.1 trp region conserved hypothetical membrane protein [Streptoalloteichus hindustanus]